MTEPDNKSITTRPVDHVTSMLKSVVGAVPIVGPFLTEVVGTLVPNQRVDRIAEFAQKLHDRIDTLDDESLQRHLENERFTEVLEESLQQAARSTSGERRQYIANLVANGINNDELEHIEDRHLLRILGELNDIEIVWLIAYAQGFYIGQTTEFQRQNANVLSPVRAHMGSSQSELDKDALQNSYKIHLEREGLLKTDDRGRYEVAPLGRLLVRRIGMEGVA